MTPAQRRLWDWLQQLPPIVTVDLPEMLQPVSAQTVRGVAAERRRSETQAEIAALRERVADLERALDATQQHANGLEWTRDTLTAANAELTRVNQATAAGAELAAAARAHAELARAQDEAILAVIRSSRSWRLTRPLRAVGALARPVMRRLTGPPSR